jgi:hypothetical protein
LFWKGDTGNIDDWKYFEQMGSIKFYTFVLAFWYKNNWIKSNPTYNNSRTTRLRRSTDIYMVK